MVDTRESFFSITPQEKRSFRYGQNAPEQAAVCARLCPHFAQDDEDECTADEDVSCYNCRWRRWSATTFTCMTPHHAA